MSKYEIGDNHEWADEQKARQQQQEWENRASLDSHTVTVQYDEDQEYQSAEKYECLIKHNDRETPIVLRVKTFQNKGNYWRERPVSEWIDYRDMPMPARMKVADVLGMEVSELTAERRLVENGS